MWTADCQTGQHVTLREPCVIEGCSHLIYLEFPLGALAAGAVWSMAGQSLAPPTKGDSPVVEGWSHLEGCLYAVLEAILHQIGLHSH